MLVRFFNFELRAGNSYAEIEFDTPVASTSRPGFPSFIAAVILIFLAECGACALFFDELP